MAGECVISESCLLYFVHVRWIMRASKTATTLCAGVGCHIFLTTMSDPRKYLIILMALLITSCVGKQEAKTDGERYSTVVYYEDDYEYRDPEKAQSRTDRLLSRDTLYIYFESDFNSDTVDVKINNQNNRTLYLSTDNSVGLADMQYFGTIKSIDKIEITKNNGKPLTINLTDKTMNIWTVQFYSDTLRAQRRKYLQWYE